MNYDLYKLQYSKITLKIKGIGYNTILGDGTKYNFSRINYPKKIIINGNKKDLIEYKYYFNQTDNIVELIWDNNINNFEYMFSKCSEITDIDLSLVQTLHL